MLGPPPTRSALGLVLFFVFPLQLIDENGKYTLEPSPRLTHVNLGLAQERKSNFIYHIHLSIAPYGT